MSRMLGGLWRYCIVLPMQLFWLGLVGLWMMVRGSGIGKHYPTMDIYHSTTPHTPDYTKGRK